MKKIFIIIGLMIISLISFSQNFLHSINYKKDSALNLVKNYYSKTCLPSGSYTPDSAEIQTGRYYHKKGCNHYKEAYTSISWRCYYTTKYNQYYLGSIGIFKTFNGILPSYGIDATIKWFYFGYSQYTNTLTTVYKVLCIDNLKSLMINPVYKDVVEIQKTKKQQYKIGVNVPFTECKFHIIPLVDVKYIQEIIYVDKTRTYSSKCLMNPEIKFLYLWKHLGISAGYCFNNEFNTGLCVFFKTD